MANRFSSRGWRFFIMAVLALLMMIPLLLVQGVVWDRENYYEQALREVGAAWGGPQTIGVPTLFVTTERQIEQTIPANGEQPERTELRTLSDVIALTPEETAISASIETEMRQRGIFEVPVFRARVTMFSRFEPDRIDTVIADGERILWQTARIGVSVRETRGLREAVAISNGRTLDVEPGFAGQGEGFSVPITRSALAEPLEIAFTLNGAESIALQPGGRDSRLEVTSTWPDPSFGGGFLPEDSTVRADGFDARWQVPFLALGEPQVTRGGRFGFPEDRISIRFFDEVDIYTQAGRAAKYGILFIALTFLTIFLIEKAALRPVHPAQYVLIGIAQSVFFLLLLSLSEQIGFGAAYLAASVATIGLLTFYGFAALRLGSRGWMLVAVLITLYAMLYLILRSADYALLAGSILAFLAVTLAMVVTRNEDWGATEQSD